MGLPLHRRLRHRTNGQAARQESRHRRDRGHCRAGRAQLAKYAEELYVFQRTPAAIGVRDNGPTDVEWFQSLQPGWHAERVENFTRCVTGEQPGVDLVKDGWTKVNWVNTQDASSPEHRVELDIIDFEIMEEIRARVDEVIDDPATAEKLKPWYGKHCKRITFHDEYLPTFNLPHVHLVDTDGQGIERITPTGAVVDGEEYELDLIVFASGFEVTTDQHRRLGFDPAGRDGVRLRSAGTTVRTRCTASSRRSSRTC